MPDSDDTKRTSPDWNGPDRRVSGQRRSGKERRTGEDRREEDSGPPVGEPERRKEEGRQGGERRASADRRTEEGWVALSLDAAAMPALELEDVLVRTAREARARARAPYSGFMVGAALETVDGQIVTGCNIENASYGLTVCAERVALLKALSEGHEAFTRIAVVADTAQATPPCGACRQLLWEYCGDIQVVLASLTGVKGRYQLSRLLPIPFDRRLLSSE